MSKKIILFLLLAGMAHSVIFPKTVPVTNKNLRSGLSLYNWVCTPDYILATGCGASMKMGFKDTHRVELQLSTSHMKFSSPDRFPIIAWSVNGGEWQSHQVIAGEQSVVLSSGIENPMIDLYIKGMSSYENRYIGDIPENSLMITGIVLDDGGSVRKIKFPRKIWLDIGDSIMSGDAAAYAEGQGRPKDDRWAGSDDARACYGYLLANHYGYREARIAYGGYNWGRGMAQLPTLSVLIDSITSTTSRLNHNKLCPSPDIVLINLGENGVPTMQSVTDALSTLRNRIKKSAKIIVMTPVSGRANAEVSQSVHQYQQSSGDNQIYLVDLKTFAFGTADGQHPTAGGHQTIFRQALPIIDVIIK